MKIKSILIIISFLFISSCTRESLDNPEYFSFGEAYGFCQGNCATFFQIKDNMIYPDDIDRYVDTNLKFKTEALGADKYNLAKQLIENFPSYLTNNPDQTFGCPDCADQGGIHIEIKEDGQIKRWHFDTKISLLPAAIRDYVQEVSAVIGALK